jgi:Peptidase S24-like
MTSHDPADVSAPRPYPQPDLPETTAHVRLAPLRSRAHHVVDAPETPSVTHDTTLAALCDPAQPLLDPDDPANADAYTRLAAVARATQSMIEWEETRTRARTWAARMSAWARARTVPRAGAAQTAGMPLTNDRAGRRSPLRTIAGLPARYDVGDGARGLRVADACARRLSARRGAIAPALDVGVAAGDGRELWDAPVPAWVSLPSDLPDGRYFAVPVAGDSMEPLLSDGDLLLVRVDVAPVAGTVVVARHPDDGYVVKRLAAVSANSFTLAPANPVYPTLTIPRDAELVAGRVVLAWRA